MVPLRGIAIKSSIITADRTGLYATERDAGQVAILIHAWPLAADRRQDQAVALADAGYLALTDHRCAFCRAS